ncbi:MAG: hypothetical protein R2827_00230 [Bdellovibrionales bacterium]
MKNIILVMVASFVFLTSAVYAQENVGVSNEQFEAARHLIEDSQGHFGPDTVANITFYAEQSKVLSEIEVITEYRSYIEYDSNYIYVSINIDDSVYQEALVILESDNDLVEILYLGE